MSCKLCWFITIPDDWDPDLPVWFHLCKGQLLLYEALLLGITFRQLAELTGVSLSTVQRHVAKHMPGCVSFVRRKKLITISDYYKRWNKIDNFDKEWAAMYPKIGVENTVYILDRQYDCLAEVRRELEEVLPSYRDAPEFTRKNVLRHERALTVHMIRNRRVAKKLEADEKRLRPHRYPPELCEEGYPKRWVGWRRGGPPPRMEFVSVRFLNS